MRMANIAQLLTEHMAIWTSADTEKKSGRGRASGNAGSVYGVKKLRELILELAVRGKLVPQDANDEPASELLKRIQAEKAKLVAEGKIKKEKPLSPITDDEKPFELPQGWELVKLGDIAYSQAGFAFKSNCFNESGLGLPLIRIRDVGQTFTGTYFNGEYRDEFVVVKDDYLISMDGEFRVAKWLNENALLNQRVSRLIFLNEEIPRRFIAEALQAELKSLQGIKAYTTVDHLSGGQISNSILGFPPLAEQYRIVAKVDELMALCDQLEAQHSNAAEAHEKLVSHLLGTLTQSQSADEFNANWQRIAAHFDVLFTTEASIDALKQTLLQLAVMGKLVPQDSNDEPASELLKRIQAEKSKLLAKGKVKQDKALPPVNDDEKPFEVPSGWVCVRLNSVIDVRDGTHDSPKEAGGTDSYPLVTSKDFFEGYINFDTARRISEVDHIDISKRSLVEKYDILFSMIGGNIGNQVMVNDDRPFSIKNVALFKYYDRNLTLPLFIKKYTENLAVSLQSTAIGGAQPFVSLGALRSLAMALPPLNEQQRIVDKVDALMVLCNHLKTRIQQANQQQQAIANALVAQAVT